MPPKRRQNKKLHNYIDEFDADDSDVPWQEKEDEEDEEDPEQVRLVEQSDDEPPSSEDDGNQGDDEDDGIDENDDSDEGPPQAKKARLDDVAVTWSADTVFVPPKIEDPLKQVPAPETDLGPNLLSSLSYLRLFLTTAMIQYLVFQTNLYAQQKDGISLGLTAKDLEIFLGMEIVVFCFVYAHYYYLIYTGLYYRMGLVSMRSVRMYWEGSTRMAFVANVMGRDRFLKIKRYLHLVDNESITPQEKAENRLWKLGTWVDQLNTRFETYLPTEFLSVDEIMVGFRGKTSPVQQYCKKKPTKSMVYLL